jgi:hypothetical protein
MSRELVNAICRTFPGAEMSDPWGGGHDAWKVGGKMFACNYCDPATRLRAKSSHTQPCCKAHESGVFSLTARL